MIEDGAMTGSQSMDAKRLRTTDYRPDSMERLLTESEAIEALGLIDRPNPGGALRWLLRTKRLGCVRLGRILRFRPADIRACIERAHEKARI